MWLNNVVLRFWGAEGGERVVWTLLKIDRYYYVLMFV